MDKYLPVLVAVVIVVFIFVYQIFGSIRNYKKGKAKFDQLQSLLEVGKEIVLSSGVHGVIKEMNGKVLSVKIADNVVVKVEKGYVSQVVEK